MTNDASLLIFFFFCESVSLSVILEADRECWVSGIYSSLLRRSVSLKEREDEGKRERDKGHGD